MNNTLKLQQQICLEGNIIADWIWFWMNEAGKRWFWRMAGHAEHTTITPQFTSTATKAVKKRF